MNYQLWINYLKMYVSLKIQNMKYTTLWTRLFVNYVIKTKGYSTYVRTLFSVLKDGTGAGEASREDEFPEVPGQPGEWVRRKWYRLRVQVNIKINSAVKPMNCVQICTNSNVYTILGDICTNLNKKYFINRPGTRIKWL